MEGYELLSTVTAMILTARSRHCCKLSLPEPLPNWKSHALKTDSLK